MTETPRNPIEFEMLGIGTVLKRNRLVVPLNQREYSWEERHVQELFQDIADAIATGKQAYFLGAIVLTHSRGGSLEVADGQQRLATTTILLAAMRDYYYIKGDQAMASDLSKFLQVFVRDTREDNPILRLNVTDNDFFSKRILKVPDDESRRSVTATQPSHQRLERAANIAKQHVERILAPLSESVKEEHLNDWINFIEHSAQVITLTVPDEMNAYVMFETLNDRGLRVSQSDLVKSYLFSQAATGGEAESRLAEAQDRWSSMNGALETLDDDEATINFLRHLLISIHGPVREREVLERIRSNVSGRASSVSFLDTLSSAAGDYVAIQTPTHMAWSDNAKLKKYVDDLQLLRVTPLRPLMLAVFREFTRKETETAFRRFVSWSVRWLVAGGARSGSVETAIGTAARKVTSGEIQRASALVRELEPSVPNDSSFKLAFRNLTVSNHKMARYYLRTLEMKHSNQSEPELVPNESPVITLEHVLPENPGPSWPGIQAAIHSTYFKRLGNMVLLRGTLNNSIGNAKFDDKKPVFQTSEYELTKEVAGQQTWGPSEIEQRQDDLSEIAVKAWPLK